MRKGEWWLNSMKRGRPSLQRWSTQQGQAFLFIVILIAFFLLAVLGLATDYTQVWAHRQMAQGAADAACEAGAADVFLKGTDPTASTDFPALDFSWIGSSFDCSAKPNSVPCEYASFNGYAGANVSVSTVDLHQARPTNNGSDFAVFGGPAAKPTGVNVGTAGHWIPGANPFGDPFAAVAAPTSAPATAGTATPVPFAVNGCPDPVG